MRTIPIFFTIDDAYVPWLHVALTSIISNASKENNYKVFVLYEGVSNENISNISQLANDYFEIKLIEMKDGLESITDRKENRLRCDYFTMTIYFRLFIAEMFPEFDKGIYIDSDIIVPGDISKLYDIELGNNIIGACSDKSIIDVPPLVFYLENCIGVDRYEYINSGVLLMNLKAMRELGFCNHFLDLMNKYHFDSVAPDQDYINAMCNGKILYLDETWDAMPAEGREPLENPNLIHYNLFQKPWCYDDIPYEEYFWGYAEQSIYYENIIEFKNQYSDEQKESDSKCMQTLVETASVMHENDITFKKIYESGEKVRL